MSRRYVMSSVDEPRICRASSRRGAASRRKFRDALAMTPDVADLMDPSIARLHREWQASMLRERSEGEARRRVIARRLREDQLAAERASRNSHAAGMASLAASPYAGLLGSAVQGRLQSVDYLDRRRGLLGRVMRPLVNPGALADAIGAMASPDDPYVTGLLATMRGG